MSDSLWPHEPQHVKLPCPSSTPGVHPNPCSLSRWCHPTISASVIPFPPALHLSHVRVFLFKIFIYISFYLKYLMMIPAHPLNQHLWKKLGTLLGHWDTTNMMSLPSGNIQLRSRGKQAEKLCWPVNSWHRSVLQKHIAVTPVLLLAHQVSIISNNRNIKDQEDLSS